MQNKVRITRPSTPPNGTKLEVISSSASSEEIKQKLEQQLKLQRTAHHQKKTLELEEPKGQQSVTINSKLY